MISLRISACLGCFVFLIQLCSALKDYPWMYYLPYGRTVKLKPLFRNKTEKIVIKSCRWTTPNKQDLIPDVYILDKNRYRIDKSKCELTIYNNQKDTNGVYHATINGIYISKAMLNVHGAPKKSLYDQYYFNFIAGFSAAAGILAFFGITCSVYKFRYVEPTSKSETENYHQNKSFNYEEDNKAYKSDTDSQTVRF